MLEKIRAIKVFSNHERFLADAHCEYGIRKHQIVGSYFIRAGVMFRGRTDNFGIRIKKMGRRERTKVHFIPRISLNARARMIKEYASIRPE